MFFGADDDPNTGKQNATPTSSLLSYFIIKAYTENTIQVFELTLYFEKLRLSVMCLGTIPTSQPPSADAVTLQHEGQRPRLNGCAAAEVTEEHRAPAQVSAVLQHLLD